MSELSWFLLSIFHQKRASRPIVRPGRRVGVGAACIASIRENAGSVRLVPLGAARPVERARLTRWLETAH